MDNTAPDNAGTLDAKFRNGREARENDVFIAVMGVTGAGKSSFISLLADDHDVEVGDTLRGCTLPSQRLYWW